MGALHEVSVRRVLAFHNAPVVFFGKEAGKLKRYMSPMTYSYVVSHPASAAYRDFGVGCRRFIY